MRKNIEQRFHEHEFGKEDDMTILEGSPKDVANLLQNKLENGECFTKGYRSDVSTTTIQRDINLLNEAGLDVGKGNAEFGYKMPLPNKKDYNRKLIIFRRR